MKPLLLFLLLVAIGDILGEFLELPAVADLDLRPPLEEVLHFAHDGVLSVKTSVQALQLLVQLHSDV